MFHSLALLSDMHEGYSRSFKIKGLELLLIESDGERYLIEDRCPHMDAKLSTGKVTDTDIICRAHGIAFCLSTGKAQGPLADTLDCLKVFPIVYEGNKLGVDL